jgi:Kef-type K+ transport system membrane component KefB
MTTPVNAEIEHVLLTVIVQLIVIIGAARIAGVLFRSFGQPQVCGEIAAGLILGPSLLGGLFPAVFHTIFNPSVGQIFSVLSQIGLILLMFLIGLEFDFGHLRAHRHVAFSISAAGIVFPFGLGVLIGRLIHAQLGLEVSRLNFCLFMGTALSITAIPILGRIMIELNINRTRIGSLTISAAALDDVSGWIILAFVTAIVRARFDPVRTALMVLETAGYGVFMALAARPLLKKWTQSVLQKDRGELSLSSLAIVLILIFVSAAVTNLIGIFSIFGGFMMGAILFDQSEFREAVRRRLHDFVMVFFLPIFFTYTGLRTDIGTMQGGLLWGLCGLVLVAAVAGKWGGCMAAAILNGEGPREAALIGVLMNTRALMELIVINIGYDLGIIPKTVFFMLVFMAVVTTYMTTPLLRRLIRSSELEPDYRASELSKVRGVRAPASRARDD